MKSRKSARPSGSGFRKTLQLCKQVERTLNQVLSGECDDDVLRELLVVGVQPLAGTSQLLVMVQPFDPVSSPGVPEILEHLVHSWQQAWLEDPVSVGPAAACHQVEVEVDVPGAVRGLELALLDEGSAAGEVLVRAIGFAIFTGFGSCVASDTAFATRTGTTIECSTGTRVRGCDGGKTTSSGALRWRTVP